MKVDTIQVTFVSNQSNLDEGWYESKNSSDTIQQGKTQDHKTKLILFLWFDSGMIRIKKSWIDSNWHDHQKPIPKKKNDTIQGKMIRFKGMEKSFAKKRNLIHKTLWRTLRVWIARCYYNIC
jgi:hypothetical protein